MANSYKDDLINSSKQLKNLFEEYLNDTKTNLMTNLKLDEKGCANSNPNNYEGYAKCLTTFEKEFKIKAMDANLKATFFKRKIEECMKSSVYKTDKGEGTKYCMKIAKDQMHPS